ncbi:MAG TPA: cbb3-type cytochrome c oxidase subunit 3 [Gemmatimonadaceae bacterium]|nr:cbb3-type cytochrome c oxidase subunit 3 [Gemmatimonadaceae bacterium]
MSLTDLMSGAGLSHYAVVALILFFASFVALGAWIFWPGHRAGWRAASAIPLDDDTTTTAEAS